MEKKKYVLFYPDEESETAWIMETYYHIGQIIISYEASILLNLKTIKDRVDSATQDLQPPFYVKEIVDRLGINKNAFQEWTKKNLIVPSIPQEREMRKRLEFSKADLYRIAIFKALRRCGIRRSELQNYMISKLDLSKTVMIE